MAELSDKLSGDLVVIYQYGDLALVQSFWGKYLCHEKGKYKFHITEPKEVLLSISVRHRIKDGQDILIDPDKITRLMKSEGSKYETTWNGDMGLTPEHQGFYEVLSQACDLYCGGWGSVQVEVFFKERRESLYGQMSHEVLDMGMLDAKRNGGGTFSLATFGSKTTMPVSGIDRIMVYSWPNGFMGERLEEVGYQAL